MHLKRKEMKATIRDEGRISWGILGKLLSPMTLTHVRNGAQCHQQGQVQPTNLGQQGAKGAHSSRRAPPPHTHQELRHRRST